MATILIVGGADGLGGTLARGCLARHDRILLADRAEALALAGIESDGSGIALLSATLDNPAEPGRIVATTLARLGTLDALVIMASRMESAPLAQWTPAMWDQATAINLRLPFLLAQAAVPALARSADASITFLSSTAALRGQPHSHAYQATKAGLAGLMRALTAELGPNGIRVNCVLPGWLDTPLTARYWAGVDDAAASCAAVDRRIPLRRHGSAEEATALLLFLTRPEARYITGASFTVDGGDTAV
ncbi:MAG TPA: SDR family oxidoreductase [Sphingomonas sp.]